MTFLPKAINYSSDGWFEHSSSPFFLQACQFLLFDWLPWCFWWSHPIRHPISQNCFPGRKLGFFRVHVIVSHPFSHPILRHPLGSRIGGGQQCPRCADSVTLFELVWMPEECHWRLCLSIMHFLDLFHSDKLFCFPVFPLSESLPCQACFPLTCMSLQMLARLLKSSHPEDLRAANKLIKEMVQEVSVFTWEVFPPPSLNWDCFFYMPVFLQGVQIRVIPSQQPCEVAEVEQRFEPQFPQCNPNYLATSPTQAWALWMARRNEDRDPCAFYFSPVTIRRVFFSACVGQGRGVPEIQEYFGIVLTVKRANWMAKSSLSVQLS